MDICAGQDWEIRTTGLAMSIVARGLFGGLIWDCVHRNATCLCQGLSRQYTRLVLKDSSEYSSDSLPANLFVPYFFPRCD